jgi:deoxyribodipyrimidine photo-lyase
VRTLVWFRGKDLRLADHGPLFAAAEAGEVVPLFVLDPYFFEPSRAAELAPRMQFLLESLTELAAGLARLGAELCVVEGHSVRVLPRLAALLEVDRVVAHRWTEPLGRRRDRRIADSLRVPLELFEGETLLPPGSLRSGAGTPYLVYSPFARAHRAAAATGAPLPPPPRLRPAPKDVLSRVETRALPDLAALRLQPNPRQLPGGERAAKRRLEHFLAERVTDYAGARDQLAVEGTSRLSADLKFGTLSVRTAWRAAAALPASEGRRRFEDQLLWREFAHHTLWDRPELLERPLRREFERFPWGFEPALWQAWASGHTGYPLVDAAARQLLTEGYVHNRARMVAASFLTKHLLIHYRYGEAHYLRHLVDGDWAQNNFGWQWSAGSGADAQPYFRVFNPVAQSERFDPEGEYIRRYVPELSRLPRAALHAPFRAPASVLAQAGFVLGRDYPRPIVDHDAARARFLALAKATFGKASPPPA